MQWQPHTYLRMARDADGEEYVDSRYDEALLIPLTEAGQVILASEPSPAFGQRALILPEGVDCCDSGYWTLLIRRYHATILAGVSDFSRRRRAVWRASMMSGTR
jgi:hypothetical protein